MILTASDEGLAVDLDKKARDLRQEVRSTEIHEPQDYEAEAVRQAVVHTREDLVLVVSYLSSTANLLGSVKKLLLIIAVAAVVSAIALVWPLL